MANLIEQMNVLKGLSDESLNGELNAPSGAAPPYLVLSEVQRRADMRKRYEGEQARYKKRTTVVEDLAGAPPTGMPPMGGAPMPSGIAAAAVPVDGFADGGIIDYADLAEKYNTRLGDLTSKKDQARALALIAAGAGIMGGGHSNTLQNIGLGAQAGINAYSEGLKTIDSEELNLLRGLTDIGQLQQSLAAQNEDRAYRREELDFRKEQDKRPASVREFEYYQGLSPEERLLFDQRNPAYNPNALTNDMRLVDAANDAFDAALKSIPDSPTPAYDAAEAQKQALEKQKQAAILAYPKWVSILGEAGAAAKAKQYGLSDGDLLLLASPSGGGVSEKDPLGLGL